ncbi:MAG: septum formation inhibitor Maf [Alteromonadaceae bacterium]|nr:septum formation inhibitor Maf [Alteromonadaceae bacterium]
MNLSLILASKSPRRKALLEQLGYSFSCISADVDESIFFAENAEKYVLRVATAKAQVIAQQNINAVVLGADTSVIVDGNILTKPVDFVDSKRMLTLLSGRQHQVLTALAIIYKQQINSVIVSTDVFFKPLSAVEISDYWHSGEPQDKAGSYAIQGLAGKFVTHIQGSYSAVVGLPLYETEQLLEKYSFVKI